MAQKFADLRSRVIYSLDVGSERRKILPFRISLTKRRISHHFFHDCRSKLNILQNIY